MSESVIVSTPANPRRRFLKMAGIGAAGTVLATEVARSYPALVKTAATSMASGVLLLLSYGVGHCSVIVLAGTSTEWISRYLNWDEQSKVSLTLKKVCGILVIGGGAYLIYTAA